ncbi:MAG: hypothetical protein AAF502_07290 [Bacteroidota bacterium]
MKQLTICILAFALMSLSRTLTAQEEKVIGFWEIKTVEVGTENMTPVARWTKINADGTFQNGNGWLQNSKGTWTYDKANNQFSTINKLGIHDEFGGFTVSFDTGNMIWEREEEGMPVKVTLVSITELPMAPSDYLTGIWDLADITKNEKSIMSEFDSGDKHKIFIRFDRIYINFSPSGERLTGYWHIHGHKPEVTFLPHQADKDPETWKVEVNETELTITGLSDSNRSIQRKYVRRNTF